MTKQSRIGVGVVSVLALAALGQVSGLARQGGPPMGVGGPGNEPEMKLVKQFDKDGDKILNSTERQAARAVVEQQGRASGGAGGGRMGGFPGRGGPAAGPIEKGPALSPADAKTFPAAALYDAAAYRTFFLTFEDADWEAQLMAFKNTDVDVPATLLLDGKTYKDIGVHFHGASSFFGVPEGKKHSMNLKLDVVHPEQQIGGMRTLVLLNASGDATYLRSVLYLDAAREFLPASKANHARVVINGESWGAYTNVQHYSKEFINEWFKTTEGARWKVPGNPGARGGLEYLGTDPKAYAAHYEIKSKDDPASWAAFANMTKILNETPANRLEAALTPVLDVDNVLRFLAVDNVLVNDDGYWTRASDYSIYMDPKGRFHVFPWDSNETFAADSIGGSGRGGRGGPGGGGPGGPGFGPRGGPQGGFDPFGGPGQGPGGRGPGGPGGPGGRGGGRGGGMGMGGNARLDPLIGLDDPTKPLRSKLLAVPALRAKYLEYVQQIATKWLDWNTLGPLATQYQARIAADVKADTRKLDTYEAFQSAVTALKTFADERRAYLLSYQDTTK